MEYKELVLLNLEDFVEEGNEKTKEELTIDSPQKCEWGIDKIKEEQRRYELFEQATKSKIEALKEQLNDEKHKTEGRTSWLKWKLNKYLDREDVPAKRTKNSMSLKMPSGQITRKLPKKDYHSLTNECKKINDDKVLIDYCKNKLPDFIDKTEFVSWNKLKKTLKISEEEVVDVETGEIETKEVVVDNQGNILPIGIKTIPMSIEVK